MPRPLFTLLQYSLPTVSHFYFRPTYCIPLLPFLILTLSHFHCIPLLLETIPMYPTSTVFHPLCIPVLQYSTFTVSYLHWVPRLSFLLLQYLCKVFCILFLLHSCKTAYPALATLFHPTLAPLPPPRPLPKKNCMG
jgi:hypothetical protein